MPARRGGYHSEFGEESQPSRGSGTRHILDGIRPRLFSFVCLFFTLYLSQLPPVPHPTRRRSPRTRPSCRVASRAVPGMRRAASPAPPAITRRAAPTTRAHPFLVGLPMREARSRAHLCSVLHPSSGRACACWRVARQAAQREMCACSDALMGTPQAAWPTERSAEPL